MYLAQTLGVRPNEYTVSVKKEKEGEGVLCVLLRYESLKARLILIYYAHCAGD